MEVAKRTKVGLLGGTFNPIHLGHLRAAEEVRESLGLRRVIFIPSRLPPHKGSADIPSPGDRLKMVELATSTNPYFDFSDVEIRRGGPSYTIDTLRYFVSQFTEEEFYFILGSDLFREIDTWREWESLFEVANFVVVVRPGYEEECFPPLPLALRDHFRYYNAGGREVIYTHKSSKTLTILNITGIELSSTRIRELVREGVSIKYLVTDEVLRFIATKGLYKQEVHR